LNSKCRFPTLVDKGSVAKVSMLTCFLIMLFVLPEHPAWGDSEINPGLINTGIGGQLAPYNPTTQTITGSPDGSFSGSFTTQTSSGSQLGTVTSWNINVTDPQLSGATQGYNSTDGNSGLHTIKGYDQDYGYYFLQFYIIPGSDYLTIKVKASDIGLPDPTLYGTFNGNEEIVNGSYWTINSASPVPVPCTMLLLGPGLVGLAAVRRRFKR